MAEAIAVAVVGWFVAPNIKELMDWVRSYIGNSYKMYKDLEKNLEKLATALDWININVGGARPDFVPDRATTGVLWRLKDAIHNAEEVLDSFQYQILLQAYPSKNHKITLGSEESLNALKKLLDRLEDLINESRNLRKISMSSVRSKPKLSATISKSTNAKFFGYNQEYAHLVSRLTGGDARVVGIIGHAGMGKTELSQWAFNDHRITSRFTLRKWVCVHGMFNQAELLREIWKSFSTSPASNMNDDMIVKRLEKEIGRNRYLLVLDGVWNDESTASDDEQEKTKTWDTVLNPFRKQDIKIGSRILVTTRARICLETLGASSHIRLNGINNTDELMCLLKKKAFSDERARVAPMLQKALEGKVGKLHGSPMAAEQVAHKFRRKKARKDNAKNRSMWKKIESEDHDPDIFKHHVSSYEVLPPHLQRCFAFCSIFPKGWRFEPATLGKMWIALGFVGSPLSQEDGETIEQKAARYFDALVRRSLFQKVPKVEDRYVIHEPIHSMLRRVCPQYYMSIDGGGGKSIPLSVRHLSVTTGCLGQLIKNKKAAPKSLRTLLVFRDDDAASSSTSASVRNIDKGVLKEFKGVRVLDLSGTCISKVPEGINALKHLRYLGLPNTIKELGADVPKLLLLQTLGVVSKQCRLRRSLPADMNRLINLRHLDLGMEYTAQIAGIGSLEHLQGSVQFHAGKKEAGHGMGELEKLNSLRGKLHIKGLEKVKTRQEAESAHLKNKKHVKVLDLEWGQQQGNNNKVGKAASSAAVEVLKGLQPHPNLEDLHINGYAGTTLSSWLQGSKGSDSMKNLRSLRLSNCRNLDGLPLVGGFPVLLHLEMKQLRSVTRIGSAFCRSGAFALLEKMLLQDMDSLVAWEAPQPTARNGIAPVTFPKLKDVKIVHCRNLKSLEGLLCCRDSLKYLHVESCPVVTEFSRSDFPHLEEPRLVQRQCPGLKFKGPPPPPPPTHESATQAAGDQGGLPRQQGQGHQSQDGNSNISQWFYLAICVLAVLYYSMSKH